MLFVLDTYGLGRASSSLFLSRISLSVCAARWLSVLLFFDMCYSILTHMEPGGVDILWMRFLHFRRWWQTLLHRRQLSFFSVCFCSCQSPCRLVCGVASFAVQPVGVCGVASPAMQPVGFCMVASFAVQPVGVCGVLFFCRVAWTCLQRCFICHVAWKCFWVASFAVQPRCICGLLLLPCSLEVFVGCFFCRGAWICLWGCLGNLLNNFFSHNWASTVYLNDNIKNNIIMNNNNIQNNIINNDTLQYIIQY